MRTDRALTTVSVSWRQKKRNHRLLFGTPLRWVRLDWRRRLAVFEIDQIFGYERWTSGQYGTLQWNVFVLQAGAPGDDLTAVSGVRPGARILLSAYGKDRAKRAIAELEALRLVSPVDEIGAERWSVLGSRFMAGFPLCKARGYS